MRNLILTATILIISMSGRTGQAQPASPKDLGALYAFNREATISTNDCEKTWRLTFDLQGECKVDLWTPAMNEISIEPLALIGLWMYRDVDFKATVTLNRQPSGYIVRVDINDAKFKDHLNFKIARKYIETAIQMKGLKKFSVTLARPAPAIKVGNQFSETFKGPLKVFAREVLLARGKLFAEKCRESWNGFRCGANLIRSTRSESLLSDVTPIQIRAGKLTLLVRGFRAWKDGTAFSTLSILVRSDRFQRDFSNIEKDYDALVAQFSRLHFTATQVDGDLHASPVYTQKVIANLRGLAWSMPMSFQECSTNYVFEREKWKSKCDVNVALPGFLAQAPNMYSQYLTIKNLGSFVQFMITPSGWRAEFTGSETTVSKPQDVEAHFNEALKAIAANSERIFLTYQ